MVNDHADEGAHHDPRLEFNHRPFALSLAYVTAEKLVKWAHVPFPEHLCQFVSLQGGM